jgi:type IV pilus assembly protein PilW
MLMNKLQRGMSIVELMIGLTIGILMLVVLSTLLIDNTRARSDLDNSMQQVENGRYAMQLLAGELRHAGYYGEGSITGSTPASLPDPCVMTVTGLKDALPLPVQGYSQQTSSPISCLADANFKSGTDILVIRRAMTSTKLSASLDNPTPYMQSMGNEFKLDLGSNAASFSLTTKSGSAAPIHPFAVQIYFISPCSKPASGTNCSGAGDDGGFPRPTLKRLELVSDGTTLAWTTTALVEGVDQLRVEYGVDSDGDGVSDSYTATPSTMSDWANVTSVRLHLLARNTRETIGYQDTKTYTLGDITVGPTNDKYKRHAYSEAVRLMNVSGRREI